MGTDQSAGAGSGSRPDSILMDWRFDWEHYRGRVRIIGVNSDVTFGLVSRCYTKHGVPVMQIKNEDGETVYHHPRNVWPTT